LFPFNMTINWGSIMIKPIFEDTPTSPIVVGYTVTPHQTRLNPIPTDSNQIEIRNPIDSHYIFPFTLW
jgi:hypothetical protein